jgi:hypothetical protein
MTGPGKGSAWSEKMSASDYRSFASTSSEELGRRSSAGSSGSRRAHSVDGVETTEKKAWRGSGTSPGVPAAARTVFTGTWSIAFSNCGAATLPGERCGSTPSYGDEESS